MRFEPAAWLRPVQAAFWGGFHAGLIIGLLSFGFVLKSGDPGLAPVWGWRILAAGVQCAILHGVVLSLALALAAAVPVLAASLLGWRAKPAKSAPAILSGRPRRYLLAICLFVGLAVVDQALSGGGAPRRSPQQKNLLLIVVDALRADRLGCYGHSRPTSPNIDALAEHATLFERAITQYPATGPSFGSLFTAKYPRRHGLSAMDPRSWLGGDFNTTLAEILSGHGYRTGAIMTGSLTRSSGLARGFDTLFEEMPRYGTYEVGSAWQVLRSRLPIFRAYVGWRRGRDPKLVVTEAERWIEKRRAEPFFLFLHLYDPHSPYDPPREYVRLFDRDYGGKFQTFRDHDLRAIRQGKATLDSRDVQRLSALYDAEVRSADESVGRVLRRLRELDLVENTIVVLTSDHGEELYEHRTVEHGHIFNTNLHVPLLISAPGESATGHRIAVPVELIDVLPTLLGLLGIEAPAGIDGRRLPMDAEDPSAAEGDERAFAEAGCGPVPGDGSGCRIAVQEQRWKLTIDRDASTAELFDLRNDPLERQNVAPENPEVAKRLEGILREWDGAQPNLEALRQGIGEKNPEIESRLRALGYVQ